MRSPLISGLVAAQLILSVNAGADTLQLTDKASVTGRIIAEKPDSLFVDVGYTVIAIPRAQVVEIRRDDVSSSSGPSADAIPRSSVEHLAPTVGSSASGNLYADAPTNATEATVREFVGQLGEAVVQVRTPGGLGSGFFIHPDGYLVTNFHVTEGETKISIEVYHQKGGQLERRSYKDVRIVAMNKFADLSLLKVEDKDAPRFKPVVLGDSDSLAQGDRVFAIGSPLGLERTVTEGIVSTTSRQVGGDLFLQTTAQINPGNSGGPLFNTRGAVIGVTNMKLTFGEGLGFAIPVAVLKYFLQHRDAYAYDTDNPSNPFRYLEPPSRLKMTLRGSSESP